MGLFWKGRLAGNVCCKNHPALEPWHSVFVPAACVRSRWSGLHECVGTSPFSVKTLSFQRCPVVRVSWVSWLVSAGLGELCGPEAEGPCSPEHLASLFASGAVPAALD